MLWSSFYAPLPRDLIILSEGIANNLDMAGVTRVNPAVSLPLYPSYPAAYPAGRREGGQGNSRGRRGPGAPQGSQPLPAAQDCCGSSFPILDTLPPPVLLASAQRARPVDEANWGETLVRAQRPVSNLNTQPNWQGRPQWQDSVGHHSGGRVRFC